MKLKRNYNLKLISLIFLFIMISQVVSAGWFDFLKGDVTGRAVSGSQNASVSILNAFPTINLVGNDSMSPVLLDSGPSYTTISIWFIAEDLNGNIDLVDDSANIIVQRFGEAIRTKSFCTRIQNLNMTSANFSCDIMMGYYDAGARWNINVTIKDKIGNIATNDKTYFDIYSRIHIMLDKTSLDWNEMSVGNDYVAANNPLIVKNVGNTNISIITVKAYNLKGPMDTLVGAGNFTARNNPGCGGNALINNINVIVDNAKASRETKGDSSQKIYYCITLVPNVIPGSYNSINSWVTTAEG